MSSVNEEKESCDRLKKDVQEIEITVNTGAVVVFENRTPSGWNAVIVSFGAAFFYKNPDNDAPTSDEQQQRPGPIYAGGASYVQGTKSECCGKIYAACKVSIDGRIEVLDCTWNSKPNYCINRATFQIIPKQNISKDELGKSPVLDLILIET